MKRTLKNILLWIINVYCKLINMHKCSFGVKSKISRNTVLEGNNVLGKQTNFMDSICGYSSYVSHYCDLPKTIIGKFCSIGKNVRVIYGAHPTEKFVSTSPLFYSTKSTHSFKRVFTKSEKFEEFKYASKGKFIEVGNDVWIGDNVCIMQGVKISDGAIIGANSLVTKDIPPYAIAVGTPARVIKYRFDEKTIDNLIELKWWNRDIKWIEDNSDKFDDIKKIIEKWEKNEKQ